MKDPGRLMCYSAAGAAIVAVCCFTPILVILLGAVGLAAWVGYLDLVLLPALALLVGLTIFAWWQWRRDKLNRKRSNHSEYPDESSQRR